VLPFGRRWDGSDLEAFGERRRSVESSVSIGDLENDASIFSSLSDFYSATMGISEGRSSKSAMTTIQENSVERLWSGAMCFTCVRRPAMPRSSQT
jgi:hypothetical protein